MEKLIICRHGEDKDDALTEKGCEQIRRLADQLKSHIRGSSVVLISSPTGRAMQSSEILREQLGLTGFSCRQDLSPDEEADIEKIVAEHKGANTVILMAHMPLTRFSEQGWRTNFIAKNGAARIILWGKKREAVVNND